MRMNRLFLLLLLLLAPAAEAQVCQFFVAPPPAGNDGNPGTSAEPWATLDHASARVLALGASGATVCFRDGVYTGGSSLYERFTTLTTFRAEHPYRAVLQSNTRVLSLLGAQSMVFRGFEFRHAGAGADGPVVQVTHSDGPIAYWSSDVTFHDNVFHDSWNNDLLKIYNGATGIRVENNVFYNQGPGTVSTDEHIELNSVSEVLIEDNIFFNDFPGSGRPNLNDTGSFIVVQDSHDDTLFGSSRIGVRRNVVLNWQGSRNASFVLLGGDGSQPHFEAAVVRVENNLMLGNAPNDMRCAFGVNGGNMIPFRNNTVTGDLPAQAYALRVNVVGSNPVNRDVFFHNNIWSDPTGSMGAEQAGGQNDFSDGTPADVQNLRLDRNLYWNGQQPIPPGDLVSPLVDDLRRVVADPDLNTDQAAIVLPRWTGSGFPSGRTTIREEFERLVLLYGVLPAASPAIGQADPNVAPQDDVLGRPRDRTPDLGAFEFGVTGLGLTPTSGRNFAEPRPRLTLTGGPFQDGATVTVGVTPASNVFVGGVGFLKADAPGGTPGTLYDVTVTNPGGGPATLTRAYMIDFNDVFDNHPFHRFVELLVRRGLTAGCGGGLFCPESNVTREQMAVFLLRAREGPAYLPPACLAPTFVDVPCSSPFAPWIEELVRRGVTGGCGFGRYCPTSAVTREQMAVFLLRTLLGPAYVPPACTVPIFVDMPCSNPFAPWVNDLVARNITVGCAVGLYCREYPVTRGQMSVFLVATFGL